MSRDRFNLLSLQEAMDLLGISRATIDRWRKEKQLPHIKIGKEIWIDKHKLQEWVQQYASTAQQAASWGDEHKRVITIGYQSGAALLWSPLIIKRLGLFEEELSRIRPAADYKVNWINAPNGMELVEALIAGKVHIASVGDYPMMASRELGRMLPGFEPQVLAFDGKTRSGDGISVVVPSGKPLPPPELLSAGTVSTVGHSSASYRLKEWMSASGVQTEPIVYRRMGDCLKGIMEKNVGATMLWEPYLSWVQTIGAGVPLQSGDYCNDYLTGLLSEGHWIRRNEPVVIAYLKAHLRAHQFIRRESVQAAQLIHEATGFPVAVVAQVLARIRWDATFYSRDIQTLSRAGEEPHPWLAAVRKGSEGMEFRQQYLQEAVEALRLPLLPDAPLPGEWSRQTIY